MNARVLQTAALRNFRPVQDPGERVRFARGGLLTFRDFGSKVHVCDARSAINFP